MPAVRSSAGVQEYLGQFSHSQWQSGRGRLGGSGLEVIREGEDEEEDASRVPNTTFGVLCQPHSRLGQ